MHQPYVAGVDSSTQSCKVLILDPKSQTVIRQGAAPHPPGTEIDPNAWWNAFLQAAQAAGGLADVRAISVGAQQHGMVVLDANAKVIRPALLWNDTRSAAEAKQLTAELGEKQWLETTGSLPVASLTVTKLRWLAQNETHLVEKIAAICLPHDYLSWRIAGSEQLEDLFTDRSDASGTGYFDLNNSGYRRELLALALKIDREEAREIILPRVVPPFEVADKVQRDVNEIGLKAGTLLGAGCGDNAGAALGIGLKPQQATLSIGTSGVIAMVSKTAVHDANGVVNGFMDATGNWLPLVCTLNGARVISSTAQLLGVDFERFDELALSVRDSRGLKMTPYFEGERTPNLPGATASLQGMTLENWRPEYLARAAVESLCQLMVNALNHIRNCGIALESVYLIGGGAKSRALREMLIETLGVEVVVAPVGEYVALGAARQAARIV